MDGIYDAIIFYYILVNYNLYTSNKSSTYEENGAPFVINYFDGTQASGILASDNLGIAGLTVINQTFAQVYTFPLDINDGLLGMGFSSLSVYNTPTPFENLFSQNQIEKNIFSFWINR